uniref:Uncharacterized protein n=1 Tax=viral metagenome TaxID=1070528 RepID=A0A6C0AEV8_9ZZZZ
MLKTNGLYVQIGNRPWDSEYGETSNCWYNFIKVINNDYALVIGLSCLTPFFDKNVTEKCFNIFISNKNLNCIYKRKESIDFNNKLSILTEDKLKEYKSLMFPSLKGIEHEDFGTCQEISDFSKLKMEYTLQSFFDIDNCDILNVVKKLSSYNWDYFLNDILYDGIYICYLRDYAEDNDEDNTNNKIESKKYSYVKSFDYCFVNDSFDAIIENDDKSKIFAWHSPSMSEIQNNKSTQENNFPYYFIPFDLSSEETWKNEYDKWKQNFDTI